MHHSGRAAARTRRTVWAPLLRGRLRHWSGPRPSQAFRSRLAIATAQRWPYSRTISAALHVRAVVKKAALAGGGFFVLALCWALGHAHAPPPPPPGPQGT